MFPGIAKVIYSDVNDDRIVFPTSFLKCSINIENPKQLPQLLLKKNLAPEQLLKLKIILHPG